MEVTARRVMAHMLVPATSGRYIQAKHSTAVFGALSIPGARNITTSTSTHKPLASSRRWTPTSIRLRAFHTSPTTSSHPRYTYGIAASFTAKDHRFDPTRHVVSFIPRPTRSKPRRAKSKRPASGQDAFFISQLGSSDHFALGVADGVGGWVDSGVDPADFSHAFCEYMAFTAARYDPSQHGPLNAINLMQGGYDDVVNDDTIKAGGSTACVAIAKSDGNLEVANLGDSGFLQLRLNAVHYYSEPQTHAFNTPYQLAIIPEAMRARTAAFGGMQLCDMPKDSAVSKHSLRHGDVLVFATDGVWDNLSSSDILRIVSKLMVGAKAWEHTEEGIKVTDHLSEFIRKDKTVTEGPLNSLQSFLAMGIASEAKAASLNTKVDGPFAKEVQKYYPEEMWRGGKVDDICVVVAVVVEEGR
jgi:protein phosphatase PTC7